MEKEEEEQQEEKEEEEQQEDRTNSGLGFWSVTKLWVR